MFLPIEATRRNHALEHATIALLRRRVAPETRISGRSTPWGFYLYGAIPTSLVEEAAKEALTRLQMGQSELAISDLCGTNLAVGGILAGVSAILAVGRGRRLERLPQGILAALAAALLAQPLGHWVQRNVTTQAQVGAMTITRVESRRRGSWTVHLVKTSVS
ncbi:MAG: DUF6391 domain-containing protein [Dehalococcoidia bacterium]|nr:DUF6391 domain-containing protein [Dehalococcoidia bacterium]